MSSNIVCYLKNGQSIPIPELFYLEERLQLESRKDAEDWVLQRKADAQKENSRFKRLRGFVAANPALTVDEQIESATNHKSTEVIESSENDRVCSELATWLNSAIKKMPDVNDEGQKIIKTLKLQDDEALVAYF